MEDLFGKLNLYTQRQKNTAQLMLINFVVICMATCILQQFATSAALWHPIILFSGEVYRHKITAVTISRRVHKIKIISTEGQSKPA